MEVHDLCFEARDGFTGRIDYRFVREIMIDMDINPNERIEIIKKIKVIEKFLQDNKPNKDNP